MLVVRTSDPTNRAEEYLNRIICADAREALEGMPSGCVALAVTSPPYWNTVDYGIEGQIGQCSYEQYLGELLEVWRETERVLIPNGKLAIVTPVMPIPKSVIPDQHTRHLKNLCSDIEHTILANIPSLHRYSLFVWQKQTTVKMFGSYPYPPNIYEDNTIEFINVFVKEGEPLPVPPSVKEASRLTQQQWLNLTMQVWPIYPEDIKRAGGHPCPFPVVLPQRLIMMYTFRGVPAAGFAGDLVLDMFNGTGATCVAAASSGRNYVGIDLHPEYCQIAEHRVRHERVHEAAIMLPRLSVRKPKAEL
ncbi:MAG: DNA-methyltransferase [Candidatus Zipacnadales bacterium]